MRAVIQRVRSARVEVDGRVMGAIEQGFLALVGVTHSDTRTDADWLARKIAGLRIFEDAAGKMNFGLADIGGSILVVSQFTLYGDARKGRRPDFLQAARPEQAEPLIAYFIEQLRAQRVTVATGQFQAHMEVALVNDGPVTLWLDTKEMPRAT